MPCRRESMSDGSWTVCDREQHRAMDAKRRRQAKPFVHDVHRSSSAKGRTRRKYGPTTGMASGKQMRSSRHEGTDMNRVVVHFRVVCGPKLVGALLWGSATVHAALRPVDLRCEYGHVPVGVDRGQPRLSWRFAESARPVRGEGQTAYRVLVAKSRAGLASGRGLLWDSGKVASDACHLVPYNGGKLEPFTRCLWKVRVWNRTDRPSPWSEPAEWTTGPCGREDWKPARWIALPKSMYAAAPVAVLLDLKGASWVWTGEGTPRKEAPEGTRLFRRTFDLPPDGTIRTAQICLTADNAFTLFVNDVEAGTGKEWHHARTLDVTRQVRPGRNELRVRAWNAPGPNSPAGLAARLRVEFADGKSVQFDTDASWQWADSAKGPWKTAVVMGRFGCSPWGRGVRILDAPPTQTVPSPIFRREFRVRSKLAGATVFVCGLGYYELRLNGRRVGDAVLAPPFTRYDRRVVFQGYDVTGLLRPGPNCIAALLGNGFFNQHARAAWNMDRAPWRDHPQLIALLRVEYADGKTETVGTDTVWRVTTGPYLFDSIRNGVLYDARKWPSGWDAAGFDDSGWRAAEVVRGPKGSLRWDPSPPVRITRMFPPERIESPGKNTWLFDAGRNIAGWGRYRVHGAPGTRVRVRYRELRRPDGSLDPHNESLVFTGDFQTDTFVLASADEILEPRFVYHGFRYIEVSGDIRSPGIEDATVCVVGTDFERAGEFHCSNELINRIQDATLRSFRSNFVGIPTDCPHREKNGWTGDAQIAVETGLFNYAAAPAYARWLEDMGACQASSGDFPGIVPTGDWGYGTGPAWDAAYFVIPWQVYVYTGDRRILLRRHEGMQRYLAFLAKRAPGDIVRYGLGDWCPPRGGASGHKCPRDLTSTAYYYRFLRIAAQVADMLGAEADRRARDLRAARVRDRFIREFFDTGRAVYAGDTQTSYACALYFGLVRDEVTDRVLARLVEDVEKQKRHIDCGILGAKYVPNVLTRYGRADLARAMITQTDFPGWGHWIMQGATTLWEHWGGGGTHNHIMFGDVSAWFYKTLAGIRPDPMSPGFRHFTLKPEPVGDLREVRAWHRCPYGRIVSEWRRNGNRFEWRIVVPPGTVAVVHVPANSATDVTESGKAPRNAAGVTFLTQSPGRAVFRVVSGVYQFESLLKE